MAIEVLGTGQPDGTAVVKATTEKLSMYGATGVVQAATIADVTAATGTYNSTILNDLITKFNVLLDDLSDIGINAAA